MDDRIELELAILRRQCPSARLENRWVLVPQYALPSGWNTATVDTAFHIRDGYPGVSPYGIYVPTGLRFEDEMPKNFTDPAPTQPPFNGKWAIFSWEAEQWFATADPAAGHNLLTWVQGFANRFREGK